MFVWAGEGCCRCCLDGLESGLQAQGAGQCQIVVAKAAICHLGWDAEANCQACIEALYLAWSVDTVPGMALLGKAAGKAVDTTAALCRLAMT